VVRVVDYARANHFNESASNTITFAALGRPPKSRLWRPATKLMSEKGPEVAFSN